VASQTVKSIADLLTKARKKKGLTQRSLADLLGLPQSYVARYEAGNSDLRMSKLMEIARLLDLEVLFVEKENMPRLWWAMADDHEIGRRQIEAAAYEPDEDDDDEEELGQ
jgi:transcriptional regulator with XRE-family HTH domain